MKTNSSIILACLALLSGCSTLSEQECRSADWYRLGIKDGQQGELANLLDEHKESCKRYSIRPDESRYLAGREAGLEQYCQLGNAFRIGMNGEEYKGVCPLDVDAAFRRNNAAALEVYNSRKKIEDTDRQLSRKEHELTEKDTPEKEKIRLREEIRGLDRKRDRLRSDLHDQERELDHLMDEARYRSERR
ncbi:MAG TPA: DUF2799 domain-containing protein [Gallionella sp.]|nr:DUF2799 domain-containing protein [Gallionella sp.]